MRLGPSLRAAATSIARLIPEKLLLRILPPSMRWDPRRLAVAVAAPTPVAVFIGPANSAGQGYLWSRAVEREFAQASAVSMATIPRGRAEPVFPVDVSVPLAATIFSRRWQRDQRQALVSGFTGALIESGRHPYRGEAAGSTARAMRELSRAGVSTAFLWHGSDIRLPSAHARIEADSPFGPNGGYPKDLTDRLERNAAASRRAVAESDFPVFVSTPGLLDVPRAQWLPVVVDVDVWDGAGVPFTSARPVVAFAPSNSALKGDPSIDTQLRELEKAGVIDYRRVEGVPPERMPELYRSADIVLDQFRLGDYGVAACEAMAAGRVVVGHVAESVRAQVRRATGRDLPIVESRLGDVGKTVIAILDDREGARATAASGSVFARAVHDGRLSARVLAPFLGIAPPHGSTDQEHP